MAKKPNLGHKSSILGHSTKSIELEGIYTLVLGCFCVLIGAIRVDSTNQDTAKILSINILNVS